MAKRGGRQHPNRTALAWTIGCSVLSFVGAGFLGFAHTIPQVNLFTHGTLVTAMHGHMAFWGAYAMIVLAIVTYALPSLTGRRLYDAPSATYAFWASNVGMISMTLAFAVAGVTQVVLERRVRVEFLDVQRELEMHFWGLILAASLFTTGIVAFVWNFIQHGKPIGEIDGKAITAPPAPAAMPVEAEPEPVGGE